MKNLFSFLFKDYPAYFRQKPSIRRFLLLPFLVVYLLFGRKWWNEEMMKWATAKAGSRQVGKNEKI